MNYFLVVFFAGIQLIHPQASDIVKADNLAHEKKFNAEIELRTKILETVTDSSSTTYKVQQYKLEYAKYHLATTKEEKFNHLKEVASIIRNLDEVDVEERIHIEKEYFDVIQNLLKVPEAEETLLILKDFLLEQELTDNILKELAFVYLELGRFYLYVRNYKDSERYLLKSYESSKQVYGRNSEETAETANQLTIAYSYINVREMLKYADEALEIYETIKPKDLFVLFQQYFDNYQIYRYYGNRGKAEALYEKLNDYYNKHQDTPEFTTLKTIDYHVLNPGKSLYYYIRLQHEILNRDLKAAQKSFDEFIKFLPSGKHPYTQIEINLILSYCFELGRAYDNIGKPDNMEYFQNAKTLYTKALNMAADYEYGFGELQSYMVLSILTSNFKQWEEVIKYSEAALNHRDISIFNQTHTLQHNLAQAYYNLEKYDEAVEVMETEYLSYKEGAFRTELNAVENLSESAEVYVQLYKIYDNHEYLEKAYSNYFLASDFFSRLYRGGEYSMVLYELYSVISEGLISTSLLLDDYQLEVLEQIEINKSDYLWSNFLDNHIAKDDYVLRLQTELDSLKKEEKEYAVALSKNKNEEKINDSLRKTLKEVENQVAITDKKIKDYSKSYYQFSRTDFNIERFQNTLKSDECIIKYTITDKNVYAYLITHNTIELIHLNDSVEKVREDVVLFTEAIQKLDANLIEKSNKLYNTLIAPLSLNKSGKLIIIPDGFLAHLPFEALQEENGDYLLEKTPVSYSYSLRLFEIQRNLEEDFTGKMLAFAPNYNSQNNLPDEFSQRKSAYALAGAIQEVNQISSIFNSKKVLGEKATKSNFIKLSNSYDILHLAMHAIVDEENPDKSNLIFENDERLYINELYQMKIPAHLAVLSACNTGIGEIKEGEGVQSLSRAFTYAGVKSTLMSLWAVPDTQTSEIMTYFYSYLKEGKSKNEALQLAKQEYINNANEDVLQHPYYWAGFIISGDMMALKSDESDSYLSMYAGSALIIGLLIFVYFKRKNKKV